MTGTLTAILGPTNTGKTYLAMERMCAHKSGMAGFPLRLLARENYDRMVLAKGARNVALITGEEKIIPKNPSYYICTVEAMPTNTLVDFLYVDEIQMAADVERGHVFTDRLLHARGRLATVFTGAATIAPLIRKLLPECQIETRPRFSKLTYTGVKKITRLPPRSAIIAFNMAEVYALAELIRRQKGGAALVMGALSPRTRNAQVDMFQSGDVDYLVATDAVGMGLNLDVNHVCFTTLEKFNGDSIRRLNPAQIAQIAGRAGRYMKDGTFGEASESVGFDPEDIERVESHTFETLKTIYWRNSDLRFTSYEALLSSLYKRPLREGLLHARKADDVRTLEAMLKDPDVLAQCKTPRAVRLLWETAQLPDYRKITPEANAKLTARLFDYLVKYGKIPQEYLYNQIKSVDKTDGDINTLTGRIASIRIWTYTANQSGWVDLAEQWRLRAKEVEDKLSDALHEKLTQRFVDKRTSVLVKGMKTQTDLQTEISGDGIVSVEGQEIGKLDGLRFTAVTGNGKFADKILLNAADKVLSAEFQKRAADILTGVETDFELRLDGGVYWNNAQIGRMAKGTDVLHPSVCVLAQENMDSALVEKIRAHLNRWLSFYLTKTAAPLYGALTAIDDPAATGATRAVLYRITENLGVLRREKVKDMIKVLTDDDKKFLAKAGVRLGYDYLFFPMLLKPAAQKSCALLWKLDNGHIGSDGGFAIDGKMSIEVEPHTPKALYFVQGYIWAGKRAIRVDVMERFTSKLREITRAHKDEAQPLPLDLLSTAGLKRDEAAEVFDYLGFTVCKETKTEGEKETEILTIRPKERKPAQKNAPNARKGKFAHKSEKKPVAADPDSPFACLAALKKK